MCYTENSDKEGSMKFADTAACEKVSVCVF